VVIAAHAGGLSGVRAAMIGEYMANEVKVPKLGLTMDEAFVASICVGEGDRVKKGDTLFEIETDKITTAIESEYDGIVKQICIKAEETYPIGEVMAIIE